MVIVGKTSFRVREPCPSFYLFGCLYYTIRASRFTRGGGILRRPLQRKQRKHRTFLTLFLYTILKYLFIKILCFRCSWLINGVIKPFVAAQNLHKTGTELHRTPARRRNTPSPIPPFSPKVAPKRATQTPAPRINSTKSFLRKTKEKNKTDSPTTSKWQIGLFLWQKAARREPERSAASAKRAVTPHRQVQGRSPWRAFGDFPRDGKVTRGWRGGAPSP